MPLSSSGEQPSTGSLRPDRIGVYTILEKIGSGGMATVYRAVNPATRETVALKVLAIQYWDQAEARTRFVREAYMLQQFDHPNILPVYDFGEDGEMLYLVMRLLEGPSLADVLDHGPLPPDLIGHYTRQIASALDYAHARGIIHRDIKPANILLDNARHILLADFGVASPVTDTARLTDAGAFIGTVAYASPEQCRGEVLDRRSDIYSLAVLVFQMATGRLPFAASSAIALIKLHLTESPPNPLAFNSALPIELYDVLLHGLAKLPDDRYPSAMKFSEAIDRAFRIQPQLEYNPRDDWLVSNLAPVHLDTGALEPADIAHIAPPTSMIPLDIDVSGEDTLISFAHLPVAGTEGDPFAGEISDEFDPSALYFDSEIGLDAPTYDASFAAAFGTVLLAIESLNNSVAANDPEVESRKITPIIRPIGPLRPRPKRAAPPELGQRLYIVVLSSVAVLALVAIGVMLAWRAQDEPPPTRVTHSEPALGITFDYPGGWTIQAGQAAVLSRATTGTVALADVAVPVAGPYDGAALVIALQKIDPIAVFGVPDPCISSVTRGPQATFACMAQRDYTTPSYSAYRTPRTEGVTLPGTLPPGPASLPAILLPTGDTPWIALAIVHWDGYPDARAALDTVAQSVR